MWCPFIRSRFIRASSNLSGINTPVLNFQNIGEKIKTKIQKNSKKFKKIKKNSKFFFRRVHQIFQGKRIF